jgi:hypothetical protein
MHRIFTVYHSPEVTFTSDSGATDILILKLLTNHDLPVIVQQGLLFDQREVVLVLYRVDHVWGNLSLRMLVQIVGRYLYCIASTMSGETLYVGPNCGSSPALVHFDADKFVGIVYLLQLRTRIPLRDLRRRRWASVRVCGGALPIFRP